MFDEYFTRIKHRHGAYMGETMRKQTGLIVDATWKNSISARPVCVEAVSTGLPKQYSSVDEFQEVLWAHFEPNKRYSVGGNAVDYYLTFMPHTVASHPEINIGSYVNIPNVHGDIEQWMIVYMTEEKSLIKTQILKCNWVLKWVSGDKIYSCLGIERTTASQSSGIEEAGYISTVDSDAAIWLPTNDDSCTIGVNTRFLISDSRRMPPLAWTVSRIRDTTPIGIMQIGLRQDLYNADSDNAELMIADYRTRSVSPTPVGSMIVKYSGTKPTIKVGGSFKTFTAQLPEDNRFDVQWSISDGENTYDSSSGSGTNTYGDYTITTDDKRCKIKIAQNYDLVGKILVIKAVCADGKEGRVEVEVVS